MHYVPNLFIDKLSLLIAVSDQDRDQVDERLTDASEPFFGSLTFKGPGAGYQHRFALHAPNGEVIAVLAGPTDASKRFLKLEYAPARIGDDGRALLRDYLRFVLGRRYRRAFFDGTVLRIDITFDVRRIRLRDLWFTDLRPSTRVTAVLRGAGGEVETFYFPLATRHRAATRQLVVYDKKTEQELPSSRAEWLRVEYVMRKADYPLGALYQRMSSNPYNNFIVRRYRPIPGLLEWQSRSLFEACVLKGRENVLAAVPPGERDRVEELIGSFGHWRVWGAANRIWHQLRTRIVELLPPT
jgi:hypothetical protein